MRKLALVAVLLLGLSGAAAAATVPYPVFEAVNGRVVGWAKTGSDWFLSTSTARDATGAASRDRHGE